MNSDTDSQISEANLLEMAAAADEGREVVESAAPAAAPAPANPGDGKDGKPEARPDGPDKSKADTTADTPPKPGEKKEEPKPDTKPDEKPESAFTKADKEKKRRDVTWAEINAEKDRLAKEKADLATEKERIKKEVEEARRVAAAPADPLAKYSDKDLLAAAKNWEEEGKDDLAKRARDLVAKREVVREAEEAKQAQAVQQDAEFQRHYAHYRDEAIKANPDLQNKESDLYKETVGWLNHKSYGPSIKGNPMGVWMAAELAKLSRRAAAVPALETEVAELKKENARLNGLMAVKPSPVNGGPAQETGELTESSVLAAAQAYDNGG